MNSRLENHHPDKTNDHLDDTPDGFEADWLKWRSRITDASSSLAARAAFDPRRI